jgi:hypothetical protein
VLWPTLPTERDPVRVPEHDGSHTNMNPNSVYLSE